MQVYLVEYLLFGMLEIKLSLYHSIVIHSKLKFIFAFEGPLKSYLDKMSK